MLTDREREFRLRPRKPVVGKRASEIGAWSVLYKGVMRYARMTQKKKRNGGLRGVPNSTRRFGQRCVARVAYSRNAVRGQWHAHGRYVARESAAHVSGGKGAGFDGEVQDIAIAERLNGWQRAGDERMWKLIVSPEFGEQVDLQRLTRELMSRIEVELGGGPLEWVAAAHYNTEHPHVHIAIRGKYRDGQALHPCRDFIKRGIREIAEDLCTRQLGYRTELDAIESQRREVDQYRYTSLDRVISQSVYSAAGGDDAWFKVAAPNSGSIGDKERNGPRNRHVLQRLMALQRMGLAEMIQSGEWRLRSDFESVLRSMQKAGDWQKTLAAHGTVMSDPRLSIETMDGRDWKTLEGRVLVHGEDDYAQDAGRSYLMLEGSDGRVHHISYTPELEEARNRGQLRTNSFVRLRRYIVGTAISVEAEDLGDAESILKKKQYLRATARRLMHQGISLQEDGWGGWLGRYQAALRRTSEELANESNRELASSGERTSSRGR